MRERNGAIKSIARFDHRDLTTVLLLQVEDHDLHTDGQLHVAALLVAVKFLIQERIVRDLVNLEPLL